MKNFQQILVGSIFLIVLVIGLIFSVVRDGQKKELIKVSDAVTMAQYTSELHGFSFSYPASQKVVEYSPDSYAIGTVSGQIVDSIAEIRILTITSAVEYTEYSFDQAKDICAADGPVISIQCTDVLRFQPFGSDTGIRGITFFLREEKRDLSTQKIFGTDTNGPFFAFKLTSQKVVLIHPPVQGSASYLHMLAETITLLK